MHATFPVHLAVLALSTVTIQCLVKSTNLDAPLYVIFVWYGCPSSCFEFSIIIFILVINVTTGCIYLHCYVCRFQQADCFRKSWHGNVLIQSQCCLSCCNFRHSLSHSSSALSLLSSSCRRSFMSSNTKERQLSQTM
jgi:hypothetical protein